MFNWDKYPYTNFHELNADFLLARMKELDASLESVKEEAIEAATENAKEYVDGLLAGFLAEFDQLKIDFSLVVSKTDSLEAAFNNFENYVNNQIRIIKDTIDADILAVTAATDIKIADAKEEIFTDLATELANVKVINYFTGDLTPIQDMFNYLSMLHISDSIDYDTMALRAKTYSQLVLLNITYTNLAMHGNTLYI